jgi:hypothetical protein
MIIWIERPSAYGYVAVGEKNLLNPVNPVKKKKIKIESSHYSVSL